MHVTFTVWGNGLDNCDYILHDVWVQWQYEKYSQCEVYPNAAEHTRHIDCWLS